MASNVPQDPDPNVVAQLAHFFAGLGLVLLLVLFIPIYWALALVAIGSFVKEFAESMGWASWEGKQPWLSSLEDWAFFLLGELVAFGALVLAFVLFIA